MNQTEKNIYTRLKNGEKISKTLIPKTVFNSTFFENILNVKFILQEKSGRGSIFFVNKQKEKEFEEFYKNKFPDTFSNPCQNRIESTAQFRNSKTRTKSQDSIFFLRGRHLTINGQEVSPISYEKKFGVFAVNNTTISADKICIVENLSVFMRAESLLGNEFIYMMKYGRVGKNDLMNIDSNELLVFNDYDETGIIEFLRIKENKNNATFFIPKNFNELHNKYSSEITKDYRNYKLIEELVDSDLKDILYLNKTTNRFLEQESLLINIQSQQQTEQVHAS